MELQSEKFRAQIFYDYATATATYTFRNPGAATNVALAFPELGPNHHFNFSDPGFSRFELRADGRRVAAQARRANSGMNLTLARVANVYFGRGQTRVLEVKCRTKKFESLAFGATLRYLFHGPKWAGQTRSDLAIEFRAPGAYVVQAYAGTARFFEPKDAVAFQTQGATCSFTQKDEREGSLLFAVRPTLVAAWLMPEGAAPLSQTVSVPGVARGLYSAEFWLPAALVKNGVSYVRLDRLVGVNTGKRRIGNLSWNRATQTATLHFGARTLQVTKGSLDADINGRAARLKARPFTATEYGHDTGLNTPIYAPLTDVARALGARVEVDPKNHSYTLALPQVSGANAAP